MDTVNLVQNLDKTLCISHNDITNGKDINPVVGYLHTDAEVFQVFETEFSPSGQKNSGWHIRQYS